MLSSTVLAALAGGSLAGGSAAILAWTRRPIPDLAAALSRLDNAATHEPPLWEKLAYIPALRREITLAGSSSSTHLREKAIMALAGLLAPSILCTLCAVGFGWSPLVPTAAGLLGGLSGFFWPDYHLVATRTQRHDDASEALLTYLDLVTLERLGNQSASQALATAAAISQAPIFCQIRAALHRAQLEQRPPWVGLTALAAELDLPELADIADIMRLDDTGAALSGTLRARVAELRQAHLSRLTLQAHGVSESMTFAMAVPTFGFAAIFIIPPILRLLS
ncbi:MAG: type II secretion system F family protein [Propionibacteriaceae bacterium]